MVALPSKVVALLFPMFVNIIDLASHLSHLTGTSPIYVFAEPHLVVLKHYGKKEVLCLIDQMEDCFDHPFQFNPDAIDTARRTRGASAVAAWLVGLWHLCVWEKVQVPGQVFRKEHLECCYVWVQVR